MVLLLSIWCPKDEILFSMPGNSEQKCRHIKQVESNNLDKSRYQKIENQIRWRNEQRLDGIKSVFKIHQSIGSTWWDNIWLWFCPIEVADDKMHELSSQSNAISNPPTYKTKCICTQKFQNEGFVLGNWRYL